MSDRIRPLPRIPTHPIMQSACTTERQYLLMWNMAPSGGGGEEVDYVQVAIGEPSTRPKVIISSRRITRPLSSARPTVDSLKPAAQLGMLALSRETISYLSNNPALEFRVGAELVLSSLETQKRPWQTGHLSIDGHVVDALFASGPEEWIIISAVHNTSIAVVGRSYPIEDISLKTASDHIVEQMMNTSDNIIDE